MSRRIRVEIPNILYSNKETFEEARDDIIEALSNMGADDWIGLRLTDLHTDEVKYMDGVDCCEEPDLHHDGGCFNCGDSMK
jgi:hypothetical protein